MKPSAQARVLALAFVPAIVLQMTAAAQAGHEIDTEKSALTVRVYKAGLFSAFGHDHEIRAPIQHGSFDEKNKTVEFTVKSHTLRVIDPGASESDRNQVQETMLGPKVLDTSQFPQIRFSSTKIEDAGPNKFSVQGDLTLHGQTHPVSVQVELVDGRYRGSAKLRQTEFGMTPVSIAGGSVKVKDEVRVEFEIVGK